jgi:hypothetical protein
MLNDRSEEKKINIIREFRARLVEFLDELIEQFPHEGEFVIIRIFIKDQVPMADVLGRFIRDLLPFADQVKARDEKFFLNNTLLYTGASVAQNKVNHFKELWLSNQLEKDDREAAWKWMDLLNAIALQYHKNFGYIKGWERPDNN